MVKISIPTFVLSFFNSRVGITAEFVKLRVTTETPDLNPIEDYIWNEHKQFVYTNQSESFQSPE
jgi:hypothetical protein